ncbi:hypothetical protein [Amycolatopsis sp. cmx-4-54]|uniref:hypothetical protein n=1 Tax=Amycolatopsis sp. cmx-4-54 TaxID=2790936 RepID=UPI00397B8967
MTDIAAAARISAYVAERKRHLDARADVIHGFGLGPDAKVLRASDIRAVLADLSGLTRPERCQDCATDPAGPCPMCAIAIYGDVDGLAYLDARAEREVIRDFIAERGQVITAINNCHPDNTADYHRWQGHAESRRQLAERLNRKEADRG